MFETVNPPVASGRNRFATLAVSVIAHTIIIGVAVVAPFLYYTDQLPEPPDMLAFVASAAPPPPPPPPPPPAAAQKPQPAKPKAAPKEVPQTVVRAAPVEAPAAIEPERLPDVPVQEFGEVGGVPGGIAGGIVGGLAVMPAPPPPPPPPAPPKPIRVGGDIQRPTLLHRVNPEYPPIAVSAKKEGVVILEATVDQRGAVQEVRVLRSEPLLDRAAVEAVKQWRYSPLHLNGRAHPFVLTVTVSFDL
jgi:periplasmic protein TonB